jgi:two-component system, NtrC family, sensor histidine kinase HydH
MKPQIPAIDFPEQPRDKTEESQRLRDELRTVRNFLESVFQSIGSGILITETKDTIAYINRAGERILEYGTGELVGRPFNILNLREKPSAVQSLIDSPEEMDTRKEGWIRKKTGVEFPAGFTINDHLNVKGEKIGRIVIFRDLTKVYRMQEEILRMDRLVSLGKLASGIAHELRNPLAGIKTTAQALGEELSENDPKREYLTRITKEIDRLNDLLKTFFSFAKPQNLNLVHCHIKEIVNEITPFLIKEIADQGIRFVEAYHPHLPRVRVDKNQIHQVILNLFLNAIQAMPNGGVLKIEAIPSASRSLYGFQQNFTRLIVSDTGKGIPPDLINKIFDPFFTTRPKGIGLGLSIAYQIVKKHGGMIKVESEWGQGTAFEFTLPEVPDNL